MIHIDFETEIDGRFVCLVGSSDGDGAWTLTEVYDLAATGDVMSAAKRDAFVAEHRQAIDDALWDHWCSERERHDERAAER